MSLRTKIAVVCSLAILSGCEEKPTAPSSGSPLEKLSSGVRAVTIVESERNGEVVLSILLQSSRDMIASFQGTLRYDPDRLEIVDVAPSAGGHLVNANDKERGILRFAGFSERGFKERSVAKFTVHTRGPLTRAGLTTTLDVVGTEDGRAIPKTQMSGKAGVYVAP